MLHHLLSEEYYPEELSNLYNPGYVGAVILLAGTEYQRKTKSGFPLVYSYIAVTLVSIDECRLRLPDKATGRVADWVHQNVDVLIDFPQKAVALKPFVDSGLTFLGAQRLLSIDDTGCNFVKAKPVCNRILSEQLSSVHVMKELVAAALVGRWLANESDAATVMAFLGIKP
jgi:hypothetical protein